MWRGGQLLFTAPGEHVGLLKGGPHAITAAKEGYVTTTLDLMLAAGQTKTFELTLHTPDEEFEYRRLWPQPLPYAIMAAGAVIAVTGFLFRQGAVAAFADFNRRVNSCMTLMNGGCPLSEDLTAVRARGYTLQGFELGAFALGGAIAATGAILLYVNRLQPYKINLDVKSATLAPFILPGGVGATFAMEL